MRLRRGKWRASAIGLGDRGDPSFGDSTTRVPVDDVVVNPEFPLRVLLLSPSPGVDVACGDVTYTEVLLADPPPGVVYTPYPTAVREGSLRELSSRSGRSGARTARWKGAWYLGVSAAANQIRRAGLVFREPIRVFEVEAGAFDLIHVHVFSTRFVGEHPPIVASAACPLRYLYRDAFGWPMWRVRTAEAFDAALATVLRADRNKYRLRHAARAIPSPSRKRRSIAEARSLTIGST